MGWDHWEIAPFGLGLPFIGFAGALPFIIILLIVAISRGRSPWWSLLGFLWLPGLIIGLILLLMDSEPEGALRTAGRAEDIARERYARGEIDEGEYRRIVENLRR